MLRTFLSLVAVVFCVTATTELAAAQSDILAWGDNGAGQCNVPALPPGVTYTGIAAGERHTLALISDGSIAAWGWNYFGQCNVPSLPAGLSYVEVAANYGHSVARRSDGSVVAWGKNVSGECNVPALQPGLSYVEVAAGLDHTVARVNDGTLVAWGYNASGQCNVPSLPPGVSYVEIGAGAHHTVARRSDGSIIAWGGNSFGVCNVPALPGGLSYVALSSWEDHAVAIRSDGMIVGWGSNSWGEGDAPALPAGLAYTQISAGVWHSVGQRSDGAVIAWGYNPYGQCSVPVLQPGIRFVKIGAGGHSTVGLIEPAGGCPQSLPAAPTALIANAISEVEVALSWTDNASDEDGYSVEHALAGSGAWLLVGTTGADATAFRDASVLCGSTYDFRVSAINCAGSWGSVIGSAATPACIPPPTTYCTPKTNSFGCPPAIAWTGTPTHSGPIDDFDVTASNVLNRKPGLMIWSTQPGSIPLGGGTLCLSPPVIRTTGQQSGGTPAPVIDCTGQYSFHFGHAYMQNYFLAAGQTIRAQYWSRDPGLAAPNNIGLTNGLAFVIGP